MKRMWLAALTGALAISTMAVAIDVASAAIRGGVYRGGVHRVGVGRVGIGMAVSASGTAAPDWHMAVQVERLLSAADWVWRRAWRSARQRPGAYLRWQL